MTFTLLIAVALSAEPARVVLEDSRTGDAPCPDQAALRRDVISRVGYDPFVAEAPLHARTLVDCSAEGCRATLLLLDGDGHSRRRSFSGPREGCGELVESLALALALAVDPTVLSRAPAPPPEAPAPPSSAPAVLAEPVPKQTAPPPPSEAKATPLHLVISGAGGLAGGVAPAVAASLTVGVALRRGPFSVGLEGRADWPAPAAVNGGQVLSSVLLGSLAGCGHLNGFAGCVLASAGALRIVGDLAVSRQQSGALLLLGVRAQYEWFFLQWLGVQVRASGQGSFIRSTVVVDGRPLWVAPPVVGDLTAGLVALF